jgi:murein tripeptide amidase MpaA
MDKYNHLVTRFSIGKTVSKRQIEVLMICLPINKKRDNRKAIIIMARQHPGETQGSYACEGVIERLLLKNK